MDQFIDYSVKAVGMQVDTAMVLSLLHTLGCDDPADVTLLTESDLIGGGLKVVQARKLIAHWKLTTQSISA